MLFGKKKNPVSLSYDPETQIPALRCSICTGEQVAGFLHRDTGKFVDYQLVHDAQELQAFMDACHVDELKKIY